MMHIHTGPGPLLISAQSAWNVSKAAQTSSVLGKTPAGAGPEHRKEPPSLAVSLRG